MAYKTLSVATEDAVTRIQLNRPEALNALNGALLSELAAALRAADADPSVRAIVIHGSDKAFAAGADVREMAGRSFVAAQSDAMFADGFEALARCRKPVIAAVAGYCLGGGCELAMACDIVIAADSAKFGLPETNLGIIPGLGGTQRLTRAVGRAKAMDMILTGRFMDAAEAERAGLAARVVPAARLLAEAIEAAGKISAKSALAVSAAKEAVNLAAETALSEGLRSERRIFNALFATEDQKEGMAAFLEKRTPQFRDR